MALLWFNFSQREVILSLISESHPKHRGQNLKDKVIMCLHLLRPSTPRHGKWIHLEPQNLTTMKVCFCTSELDCMSHSVKMATWWLHLIHISMELMSSFASGLTLPLTPFQDILLTGRQIHLLCGGKNCSLLKLQPTL